MTSLPMLMSQVRRPWLRLRTLAAIGVVCLFIGGLTFVYVDGQQPTGPIPVVRAPDGPIKVRPQSVAGMHIPDRDKKVFEATMGDGPMVTAQAAPPVEEPIDRSTIAQEQEDQGAGNQETAQEEDAIGAQIAQLMALPPEAKPWRVQLAAFTRLDQAQAYWAELRTDMPSVLRGLSQSIDPTSRRGTDFFRLRAGPLADEAAAKALCEKLTAAGKGCLTVAPQSEG